MAKYEIDTLLELSKASSKAPQVVEDFVVQFQAVTDLLAARQAKKAKRKLPKEVTDEDGWTSFVKHGDEAAEEGGEAPVEVEVVEEETKKKSASKPQMKVKTSASKMTRSGNGGGEAVIAINQTKAFNAFAALGGDDDDDDDE